MNEIEKFRDDIDRLTAIWDKAQADGIFADAPKPPMVSQRTAEIDFFGAADTHPTETINEVDAKYWNTLSKMNGDASGLNVMLEGKVAEATDNVETRKKTMNKMATATAPIRQSSVGKDQDPANIGVNFTPEDLSKLDELKRELHELKVQLTTLETNDGSDQKVNALEKKVDALSQKIDDMSDGLNRGVAGKEISQQGD